MAKSSPPTARRFVAVFAGVALSFIGATIYSQSVEGLINRDAMDIATNAAPSILYLSSARADMRHLQTLVSDYVQDDPPDPKDAAAIARTRRQLADEYAAYKALPTFPGEVELWNEVNKSVEAMDVVVARVLEPMHRGDVKTAKGIVDGELPLAVDDAFEAVSRSIEFDASHARELAMSIADMRRRSMLVEGVLDGINAVLAICAALLLLRAVRHHTSLLEAHRQLAASRADELEQFASRVAHDILSPLASTGMALGIVRKDLAGNSRAMTAVDRGANSLQRVQRIVDGLLEFARAGAKPAAGARAEVRAVLDDVLEDVRQCAREAEIDLRVRPFEPCAVATSPGVLTSLFANLLRNAIKYMGPETVRIIEVRVHDHGEKIRIEVADTGPGIPEDMRSTIFEPYVRGSHTGQAGVGLGLGTVKRLVETHGGAVGVETRLSRGSMFWFELPRAARTHKQTSTPALPPGHAPLTESR